MNGTPRRSWSGRVAWAASVLRWAASRTPCFSRPIVPSSWCPPRRPIIRARGTPTAAAPSSWVTTAHQEHGRQLLQSLTDEHELDAELETSLLEGPPARAIVAAADARDADEIVPGSRGFGPVRGVLGSVSHAVLHETDRVVVIVPDDAVSA